MIFNISTLIKNFYDRNLFERIIIYIFISHLVTKIIFELILGQWYFIQSQNQQWIFYGLLALDYLISFKKVINIKVTLNFITLFALLIFIMIAHGLYIGILNHNPPFIIFNDTVPLLMIALNILRFQSYEETSKPIDFRFIFITVIILSSLTCFFGIIAGKASVGNAVLFYPLILAAFIKLRPYPVWTIPVIALLILLTIDDINRTTLAFIALVSLTFVGINSLKNPAKTFALLITLMGISFVGWGLLPEDSKTYQRIQGLSNIDLSERTGSIGERQAEQEAVQTKLEKLGPYSQLTGLGFGGLYEIQLTTEYRENYGHAHFGWVWFNLRFGIIGYFYLGILIIALLYNGINGVRQKSETGLFITLLCFAGIIYLFTYVNSIFLLSGLQFLYLNKIKKIKNET